MGMMVLCSAGALAADVPDSGFGSVKGTFLNVVDMEKSAKFYTEVFGLKIARSVPEGQIKGAKEVVLSQSGVFDLKDTPLLVLFHRDDKPLPPGRTAFGRIISVSTNADALAARAKAAGYSAVKSAKEKSVTMVTDPDGYQIELIQQPPS